MQQPPVPVPPQPPAAEVPPPTPTADDATPPPKAPDIVTVPTYSSWFRWDAIHECEVRHMQEFMDGKSPSRTPSVYKYYRDAMIKSFRANPSWKLTFTEVRRTLIGDVGSIRRVFDFLDTWGLINYSPPSTASGKKDKGKDKDKVSNANAGVDQSESGRKSCSGCKVACTIACFVSDKYDLMLCARCYVRGNYPVGVNSSEFRRVEISEPAKTDWTDKETLQLLEAVMHYRDDWKRVAEHVGGRTEKECVARFIKLPFQEQLAEPSDMGEDESMSLKDQVDAKIEGDPPAKRLHLTPLADASNPIMAQAAFLSALAGTEFSEAAARAAIATLYDMDRLTSRGSSQLQPLQASSMKMQEPAVESSGNSVTCTPEEARIEAESLLKQEEDEFLKSITDIIEVQMKEILDKIDRYEEMDLQLEREWQQLHQMKHQLFLDKLTLSFHKAAAAKSNANVTEEIVRAELPSTN